MIISLHHKEFDNQLMDYKHSKEVNGQLPFDMHQEHDTDSLTLSNFDIDSTSTSSNLMKKPIVPMVAGQ